MVRKKPQSNYFHWGKEKYDRDVYWDKGNWNNHSSKHWDLISNEQKFIEALKDPDYIFPDKDYPNERSCYYKIGAFNQEGEKIHAQVVVIENPKRHPPPTKGKYVIVASALPRPNIPEMDIKKIKPKFKKEDNE